MMGLDKGLLGTLVGGAVLAGVVYVLLKNSSGIFQISGGSSGIAHEFGNLSKVYQGA